MGLTDMLNQKMVLHTKNYQLERKNADCLWDVDEIIKYARMKDRSLVRQKFQTLAKAANKAIEQLQDLQSEDSQMTDEDESVDPVKTNAMNNSVIGIYNKNQNTTLNVPPPSPSVLVEDQDKTPISKRRNSIHKDRVKKPKLADTISKWATPKTKLSDLGGIESISQDLMQLIGMPLRHPEVYCHLGIDPPRGILLHGPPGCGKTLLANAIAGETNVPFINIAAPVIVSGMSGESEKKIREVFEEAKQLAPCILFIDEIDAITPKRETAQREMERRIVAQLLTCMDDLSLEKTGNKPVMIIGATNRPDSLDPALRRAGRFDREISLGVPDEQARSRILEKMCSRLRLEGNINFSDLARLTPGYVGADLNALTAEAGMIAVKRIFGSVFSNQTLPQNDEEDSSSTMMIDTVETVSSASETEINNTISTFLAKHIEPLSPDELEPLCVKYEDFIAATSIVQPSSKREGFASVPDVTWEDIGALSSVSEELRMAIVEPIKHPEYFASVGITSAMGVLLYGPPGCGKTLLAKAVANESHCNFLSVKGPELLNKVLRFLIYNSMLEKVNGRFEWYSLELRHPVHALYFLMSLMHCVLRDQTRRSPSLLQG